MKEFNFSFSHITISKKSYKIKIRTKMIQPNVTICGFLQNIPSIQCIKSVYIQSYSGPHFPAFGLNNSKYGHILHSDSNMKIGKGQIFKKSSREVSYIHFHKLKHADFELPIKCKIISKSISNVHISNYWWKYFDKSRGSQNYLIKINLQIISCKLRVINFLFENLMNIPGVLHIM